ncbi:MAG: hypothetical protein IH599_00470, partial [Bacteroidales bacterium]|nr:hypothetical protein [Bacteroidales bacterium]
MGIAPVAVIDLDDNNSSAPAIVDAIQANGFGVDALTAIPNDLSPYSAVFVCLGIYSNNHQLTSTEGQLLANYLNSGGSLYMEGGDTWFYDSKTAVHSMFNISGLSDGSADLATLSGKVGAFTSGMSFVYSGEENWIDRLSPVGNAFSIFQNSSPTYEAAIAYDAGTWRTIGSSFEFSGLSNASPPSTRNMLMGAYLDFFGLLNHNLQAGYESAATLICAGDNIIFTDTTSPVPTAWFWRFPGGTPSWAEVQHPLVQYEHPGSYPVSLFVNNGGLVYEASQQTVITVAIRPQIVEHPVDTQIMVNDTARFLASGSEYTACNWEHSLDNGYSWIPLSDDVYHSGTNTTLLEIIPADTFFNGRLYRLRLAGACPTDAVSYGARLNVSPLP